MTGSRAALHARRRELIGRAASQRDDLAREFDGVRQTFLGAELVLKVARTLEGRIPQMAIGAAAAALLMGPARMARLAAGAWMTWRTVRSLIASK